MKNILFVITFLICYQIYGQEIKFNKDETLKLITEGKAVIKGEAFAKDNQAPIKGMVLVNINKKQFPPKGTEVVLIPYTSFFKNWLEYNKKAAKQNEEPLLLPEGTSECILKTKVIDNKGTFEFGGLMPGQYFLVSEFSFISTKSTTRTEGYTHTYLNGMYIGSAPIERIYHYNVSEMAFAKKVVEIKNNGEVKKIKLKDTDGLFE